jgi:hypothetical protein
MELQGIFVLFFLVSGILTYNFNIFYTVAPPLDVQQAVVSATQNIALFLNLTQDINIAINFDSLAPSVLADSSPSRFCEHPDNTNYPFMVIPDALYSQLTRTPNCPYATDDIHIFTTVNTNPSYPFYYGTDGVKNNYQIDFVTVMMHELVHGLGMISFIDENGINSFAPDASIFDWYTFSGVAGWPTSFLDPTVTPAITDLTVLTDNSLFFTGIDPNSHFQLYTPPVFSPGSSVSHTNYVGLMYWELSRGVFYHVLDIYLVGMLNTFGYDTMNCNAPDVNRCGNCLFNYPCFSRTSDSSAIYSFLF